MNRNQGSPTFTDSIACELLHIRNLSIPMLLVPNPSSEEDILIRELADADEYEGANPWSIIRLLISPDIDQRSASFHLNNLYKFEDTWNSRNHLTKRQQERLDKHLKGERGLCLPVNCSPEFLEEWNMRVGMKTVTVRVILNKFRVSFE